MHEPNELIRRHILFDMSEGVLTIGLDGRIGLVNPAAEHILGRATDQLIGQKFASCFFEYAENDAFNQTVLDAIYDADSTHENIVSYFTGEETLQLHVKTSFLHDDDGSRVGIVVVLSDISELVELRDAVLAMEKIKRLNDQLALRNRLLSETFGRFLSDDIVRQLLDTPDGLMLGGKKRSLTVLMSDLRGFTALSEQMEPQALLTMLNHYLGAMTEVIQRRSGTIIEFIGDGILAIFGAPNYTLHHASDAVCAAVEMQSQMQLVNAWNAEHGYPELHMGIGIHTADVIVGNIGSEKRTKYGVVGSGVNLAGRVESYTVGGQILISPDTRAAVDAPLTILQELHVMPKGVHTALTLSHVVGIGAPYSTTCPWHLDMPPLLDTPIPVQLAALEGKHCETPQISAMLLARSEQTALLQTETDFAPFTNVRLTLPDSEFYAKVLQQTAESTYLLVVTSASIVK